MSWTTRNSRPADGLAHVVGVGVGEHRVFAHDVHRLDLAVDDRVEHLRDAQPRPVAELRPPRLLEDGHVLRLGDRPVVGEHVGQGAHVAGSLHVVLAAQRIDTGMLDAHVAGDHGQVGQVHDVGRAGGVLGDAQGVEDARPRGARVDLGRRVELVLGDAGDLADHRRGVFLHDFPQVVVTLAALGDELLVGPAFVDDDVHQAVDQGRVGAGGELQPEFGVVDQLDVPRIDHYQPGSAPGGALHLAADDGMRLRGVGADDEQGVVGFHLADGVRHGGASERCGQTGHRGSVSGSGTVVEIVGAHHHPDELLHQPVVFVGAAGRAQGGEGVGAVPVPYLLQPGWPR